MMDALTYLKLLQKSQKKRIPAPIQAIIEHRSQQLHMPKEEMDRAIEKYDLNSSEGKEKYLREVLIVPFLNNIPPSVSQELTKVPFGFLETFAPNACAIQVPNNGLLVVLHSELMAAISFYNELQIIAGRLINEGKHDEGLQLLHSGHNFIVGCFTPGRNVNYPKLPFELNQKDFSIIQFKTLANELFVIAHEFAHVYLGHLNRANLVTLAGDYGELSVNAYYLSQQMEFEADAQAVRWIAAFSDTAKNEPSLFLASQSVAVSAEVLMLVHIVEVNTIMDAGKKSHPLAIERLAHILKDCTHLLRDVDRSFFADMIENASDIESFKCH